MIDFRLMLYSVVGVVAIGVSGCSVYHMESVVNGKFKDATPTCAVPSNEDLERFYLAMPKVGTFIGISDYGEKQFFSTPAHAISAGLFQAPFFQAAFFRRPDVPERQKRHTYWLKTTADVRLELNDPIKLGAYRLLMLIPGIKWQNVRFYKELALGEALHSPALGQYAEIWENEERLSSVDVVLRYQGEGDTASLAKPVTRTRILDNITKAIREAQDSFRENGRVLLIIYVSGHGW